MNIEALRRINRAQPFRPFTVRTADGQAVPVPHPDFLFIPPIGSTVVIADQKGLLHILAVDHVTKAEVTPPRSKK